MSTTRWTDDNETLKDKFQKLHRHLVAQNLAAVADRLFEAGVIGTADIEDMSVGTGSVAWSTAKSRNLMTTLHKSGHPRAFVELRLALNELSELRWIVDEVDRLQPPHNVMEGSAPCQCTKCGYLHRPISPAAGQPGSTDWSKKSIRQSQ